jgi:tripartite-type tricarboxylate transporter receptor subunit TctC
MQARLGLIRNLALALSAGCATTGAHAAQPAAGAPVQYPNHPIRLICPFAPGGGTDLTARAIAQKLTDAWGQSVIVDNRPGANGTIAVDIATKALPDGYTLTMISSSHSVNSSLYKLPYDLTRDLAPITQATSQPYALVVNPSVPAKSVKELIALAKAKPDGVTYGSSGLGGLSHLSGALFASLAGIKMIHVPYKGGYPALNDVVGGQIQMLFSTLLQADAMLKSGRVRALAVTTKKRSPAAPDLPTMQEAGVPGYEVAGWYGVLAPAKTPQPLIDKLNVEIVRALKSPDIQSKLAADGSEAVGSTPAEFGAHIKAEIAKWAKVTKEANIKAE